MICEITHAFNSRMYTYTVGLNLSLNGYNLARLWTKIKWALLRRCDIKSELTLKFRHN